MSRWRRGDPLQLVTEVALFGVTVTAIVGMHLLFTDGSFFGSLVFQAMLAHATMAVLRRLRMRLLPAALVTCGVAAVLITWTQYLDTTLLLLPSPDTWTQIDLDMKEAWRLFQDVQAPAPVVPGFVVTTSLAVWVIVFIADWGAFRTGVSFEALLPPATLFLFAAVLGEEGGTRAPGATLFVAAALVFLLLHRTWRQEGSATWAAANFQRNRWAALSMGTMLALLPVAGAAVLGPNLPGADDPPILPWKDLGENDEARVVVSPLVDIRARLVDQSDVDVFTVQVDRDDFAGGAYWRITALDSFDGTIWRSTYDTDDADGELPENYESRAETESVRQVIRIIALDAIWLPSAFEPRSIEARDEGVDFDYDPDSSTLIVDKDTRTSDGLTYEVTAEIPRWSDEQLRTAPTAVPEEVEERYTQLPDSFSPRITQLAKDWVAEDNAQTPYDKARALHDHLKTFTYNDQTVFEGHDEEALTNFLFTTQEGYCEQFAGAFAAMARSLGLPTRVAVGFTQGVADRYEPRLWRVTGKQAHAWAEVYFEGFGWVTFDPTPGRAPPGGEAWLGVGGEQAPTGDDSTAADPPPRGEGNTEPTPGQQPQGGPSPDEIATGEPEAPTVRLEEDSPGLVPPAVKDAGKPVGLAVLGYLAVIPVALVALRHLRRLRARAPDAKVDLAWREATQEAVEAGVSLPHSLTVAEQALRMRAAMPDMADQIDLVAGWVEQVHYAETSPSPEEAAEAAKAAAAVVSAAARRQTWYRRLLRYLDARRLVPPPDIARRSAHGVARTRTAGA